MALRIPAVLFVCMGNTCRSPMAAAVLRHRAAVEGVEVLADSAGVRVHQAEAPLDPRARNVLTRRGYPIPEHRARSIRREDFARFDLILGATRAIVAELNVLAPSDARARILPLLTFTADAGECDIQDPFGGCLSHYEQALDLIEQAIAGLVRQLRDPRHDLST